VRFLVIQHADKERLPGDPGLTALGREQAARVAAGLRPAGVVALYSSPLRRALETAAPIAAALGMEARVDHRLTERLNWDGCDLATFVADWDRTVADRDYVPSTGDSSRAAGARFAGFLADADARHDAGPIVVVSHGGVTIDLLRDLLGDAALEASVPGLIGSGMPSCGVTSLAACEGRWPVLSIGKT
jgi:broad specificity phosphatase PhoE